MRSKFVIVSLVCVILGCNSSEEKKNVSEKEPLLMAKTSEMSSLMNEMYAYNESIKQQIIDGHAVTNYPKSFDKIHSAALTDPSDRDSNFKTFADQFIDAERAIFSATTEASKVRFNEAINSCISCHSVKCVGPIPRIKKLLIK